MHRTTPLSDDYCKLFPQAKMVTTNGEMLKLKLCSDLYILFNTDIVVLYDKTKPLFPVTVKPDHDSMIVYLEEVNMGIFSIN